MFRKLIATVVIMAFTNSYGSTPLTKKNALNAAFSELEYSLTVEWDQQDQEVADKMLKAFEAEVKTLQKDGLSNADLIDGSLARLNNKKTQEELKALFQVVEANQMSQDEARKFIVGAMKEGQVEGASWTGNRLKTKTLLILAVVLVLVVVIVVKTGDDDDNQGCTENCGDDDNDDSDEDDNDDNDDGDDDNGDNDNNGGPQGNNGWGNCDQDAPGGSLPNNGAENDQTPHGNGSTNNNNGWAQNCES